MSFTGLGVKILHCAACGGTGEKMHRCGGCRVIHYCGRECQEAHWPRHAGPCRRLAAYADELHAHERTLMDLLSNYAVTMADCYWRSDPNTHVLFVEPKAGLAEPRRVGDEWRGVADASGGAGRGLRRGGKDGGKDGGKGGGKGGGMGRKGSAMRARAERIWANDPRREAEFVVGAECLVSAIRDRQSSDYQVVVLVVAGQVAYVSNFRPHMTREETDCTIAALERSVGSMCSTSGRA